ncbi:MAG: gyrase subunit [Actinomycetota bacterium]|nr:gyrase subunit [Actinomycetota bacterium]
MPDEPQTLGNVEPIEIQEEMERSFLDYAMSVITARALPDARDGLKPVQRRILYGMYAEGMRPDRPHRKCANAVGEVMGKYHPHGDQSIYDALARMAQDFSLRYPLIDGHGNFGSPNDRPAAARYTEARLSPLAMELLGEIDEDTVDFGDTYDGRNREPLVVPARFPNLLVNGGGGIAVGMATNIPPHNLTEVINATLHLIDNPDASVEDLMRFVTGPDFPTGAMILGRAGIAECYRTGRGSIRMRATAEIEEGPNGAQRILVSQLPFQTSVESIGAKVGELVNDRRIEGIRAVTDLSAGDTVGLVIDLKRDANAQVVLNQLYKHTPMQTNFAANMVSLVDGVPRLLNLRQALEVYVGHQVEVITRRSQYRLNKARDRAHILEGLLKALDMIDAIITLIRGSESADAARTALQLVPYEFSEIQATHILDMALRRLAALERQKLRDEFEELAQTIAALEAILADEVKLRAVIKEELTAIRDKYGDGRRTLITTDPGDLADLDLIEDEELVLTLSHRGYVKTVPADQFRTQARGGKGVRGGNLREEDWVEHLLSTTAHSYLLFFSNRGRVYRLRAHEIPMKDRTARGTALVNLVALQGDEHIEAVIDTRTYEDGVYLFFATRNGIVKKTRMSEYDSSLRSGLIAINLNEGDELVRVIQTTGTDDVFMVSRNGMTIRFSEQDVRAMGRATAGVRGMKLRSSNDGVVSADLARDDAVLLFVSSSGHGKRTPVAAFNRQGRGGQGVRGMRVTEARGEVIAAFTVDSGTEILVFSSAGNIVRMGVDEISEQGRDATGVRVARLDEGDTVVAVAKVLEAESDESLIDGTAAIDASSDGAGGLEAMPNAETVVLDEPGSVAEGEED